VQSPSSKQWEQVMGKFSAKSLQVPFYAVMGNHDWRGKPEAQVQRHYQERRQLGAQARWTMPHYWYTVRHEVEDQDVLLVFLDTPILAPEETEQSARDNLPGFEQRLNQLAWLEHVLATASETWVIVVGHYPLYSAGDHGPSATLIADIAPLLEKYGVDAYFSGHDHIMAAFQTNWTQVVVGSGCKLNQIREYSANPESSWAASVFGFAEVKLTKGKMTTTWIKSDGRRMYSLDQAPRRKLGVGSRPGSPFGAPGLGNVAAPVAAAEGLVASPVAAPYVAKKDPGGISTGLVVLCLILAFGGGWTAAGVFRKISKKRTEAKQQVWEVANLTDVSAVWQPSTEL